jgi:hypothetical protein
MGIKVRVSRHGIDENVGRMTENSILQVRSARTAVWKWLSRNKITLRIKDEWIGLRHALVAV